MKTARWISLFAVEAFLVVALLLSCTTAFAQYTYQVTGTITDASTGSPIQGVYIRNTSRWDFPAAYSDSNGNYVVKCQYGTNGINIWHPDYLPAPQFKATVSGTTVKDFSLAPISVNQQVYDSFDRPDTNNPLDVGSPVNDWCAGRSDQSVGTTEDAGQYPWYVGWIRVKANIKNNALEIPVIDCYDADGPGTAFSCSPVNDFDPTLQACGSYGYGAPWTSDGVSLALMYPDDFEFTSVIKNVTGTANNPAYVCWQQLMTYPNANILEPGGQYGFGEGLKLFPDGSKISWGAYWFGAPEGGELTQNFPDASKGFTTAIDWSQPHTIKVRAQGYHQQVFFDGVQIFSDFNMSDKTWDNSTTPPSRRPGYVGYYRSPLTGLSVDSMSIDVFGQGSNDISGTVSSAADFTPIPNAKVVLLPSRYSITDDNGRYAMSMVGDGDYTLGAVADGYYYKSVPLHVDASKVQGLALTPVPAPAETVTDDFNRSDNYDLGTTTDAQHYAWDAAGDTGASIEGTMLKLDAAENHGVSIGGAFQPADFDASVDLVAYDGWQGQIPGQWAGITYRQAMPGTFDNYNGQSSADAGYVLNVTPDGKTVTLSRNGQSIAWAMLDTAGVTVNWSMGDSLRVKAVGPHHQVWIGGTKVLDAVDFGKLDGGYFGLARNLLPGVGSYSYFDNLVVNRYPDQAAGTPVDTIADAKSQPDGTDIMLDEGFVTAAFNGEFYIEESDRSSGMRVQSSSAVQLNDGFAINGKVQTSNGEKYIDATGVTATGSTNVIAPVGMTSLTAFGSVGVQSVGLLATIWGKVVSVSTDQTSCVIDDGSIGGVKVLIAGTKKPSVNNYVSCTGILRMESPGVQVLQMRSDNDLVIFN